MSALWIFLSLTALMAGFYIIYKVKRGGVGSTFAKTAASLGFAASGITALFLNAGAPGAVLCFALILGMVGDILIDLYHEEQEETGPFLIAGFISFGLEHVTVIVSVTMKVGFSLLSLLLSLVCGALFSFLVVTFMKKKLAFRFGDFLIPAYGYSGILAFCLSYYLLAALNEASCFLLVAGMAMFLVSDVVLSFILFDEKKANVYPVVNLITYYAGQILFVTAIAFAY